MISQAQKMKQQQKLSPKQMMLMRLLQLPNIMMEQAIKEELEKNPLLEVENMGGEDDMSSVETGDENLDRDEEMGFYDDDEPVGKSYVGAVYEGASETSAVVMIQQQLDMLSMSEKERVIVQEIVGNLDDAGYLSRSLELIENDLVFRQDIEASPQELETALKRVQSLEPAGIGARSLKECLLLQLHRMQPKTYEIRCATTMLEECFEEFMQHKYESIANKLEIDEDSVLGAKEVVLKLNPKPCGGDSAMDIDNNYVTPDFEVRSSDGRLTINVNQGNLPNIKVSKYYDQMLQELESKKTLSAGEKETLDFLSVKSETAKDFVDNIKQRHQTLKRTMELIAKKQRNYLLTGEIELLKPLSQHEVAEILGVDDSVISRVVNSKYVQTDFGVFPLKHFFSQASVAADGSEVSVDAIKKRLQDIVNSEDKQSPLTDDQLAEMMKESGYDLARRTIAKYRESLGIPVSRMRKLLKIFIMLVGLYPFIMMAQTPMSYYDSLIYQQQHKSSPKVEQPKMNVTKLKKLEPVDSNLLKIDDLIDKFYDASLRPSQMWYGKLFPAHRVKPETFHIDSLPDAVNLKLATSDSDFCFPIKNILTSPYGWRWGRAHRGVDIRLNMGDKVHVAFSGVVRIASPMGAYGNLVVVRHYNGLETVYGHLSKVLVSPNQIVKAGEVIGLGGSTGRSTGPHLHFEVRFQYEPFDPEWILDFNNYTLRTKHLHLDKTYFGISRPQQGTSLSYKADKSYVKEESKPRAQKREIYYVVGKDDTLESIAEYYRTTAEKIKELNPEMKKIRKGLRIRVR